MGRINVSLLSGWLAFLGCGRPEPAEPPASAGAARATPGSRAPSRVAPAGSPRDINGSTPDDAHTMRSGAPDGVRPREERATENALSPHDAHDGAASGEERTPAYTRTVARWHQLHASAGDTRTNPVGPHPERLTPTKGWRFNLG